MEEEAEYKKVVFISYLDEEDKAISGYVTLIIQDTNFIKFRSGKKIISIPYSRLLKLKEAVD